MTYLKDIVQASTQECINRRINWRLPGELDIKLTSVLFTSLKIQNIQYLQSITNKVS